jgi:hypothetical protein
MNLFQEMRRKEECHAIFNLLCDPRFIAEKRVIEKWAEGFHDRDGKFVNEFQTTFESSMWELYIHAYLREIGIAANFTHHAPDFVIDSPTKFCIEATIASSAAGGASPIGYDPHELPKDFGFFNKEATIRISNSLSSKIKKYRSSYIKFPHACEKPFVIALASYDRPYSHFASNRPIMAALDGIYHDEEAAIAMGGMEGMIDQIPQYPVDAAIKDNGSPVPLGIFVDDSHSEVSAVIFSCLATWGKIRALADNPDARSFYQTLHPNPNGLMPIMHATQKRDYHEHLLDGLHIFHNPFAKNPLSPHVLKHDRLAQYFVDQYGVMDIDAPDDFLLMRMISSLVEPAL